MPERMSERFPNIISERMPNKTVCQIRMLDRTSKRMQERMPHENARWNVRKYVR